MIRFRKGLMISAILLLVMTLIVLRIVKINDNDMMSTIDKENFKFLRSYIQKDALHATAYATDTLEYALSGDLTVINKNSPCNTSLTLGISSLNAFYGIKAIELSSEKNLLTIKSNSDWLSPYMVKSTTKNKFPTAAPAFTGGWHSLDSISPSEPSAFMKSYEIYADGKKIIGNVTGEAKTIHIIVNQLIKGYNTDEYILEEYILYTIVDNEIRVMVKTFALQDVSIEKFYGLETHNKPFDKHITYHFEDGHSSTFSSEIISDSGPIDTTSKLSHFSLSAIDSPFILSAYMLNVQAPRTMPLLAVGTPEAYTEAYGKSYFNIINGNPLDLKTKEAFEWSGVLKFTKE